jgi:hypothetical protein
MRSNINIAHVIPRSCGLANGSATLVKAPNPKPPSSITCNPFDEIKGRLCSKGKYNGGFDVMRKVANVKTVKANNINVSTYNVLLRSCVDILDLDQNVLAT